MEQTVRHVVGILDDVSKLDNRPSVQAMSVQIDVEKGNWCMGPIAGGVGVGVWLTKLCALEFGGHCGVM